MNTKASRRLQLFYLALGALALVAIVLRSIALARFFNDNTGYFTKGALPIIVRLLEVLGIALCAALPFLIKKDTPKPTNAPLSIAGLFACTLCALTLTVSATYFLVRRASIPTPNIILLLAALFLLASTAYFINQFRNKQEPDTALPFGYIAILGVALLLATLYFDLTTPMNAPHKVSLQIALLSVMIAILYELRSMTNAPHPRAQAAVCGFAFFACAVTGIPNAIAFVLGTFDKTFYLLADFVCVALALYFGVKCATLCQNKEADQ